MLTQCRQIYYCNDNENQYLEVIRIDFSQTNPILETQIMQMIPNSENYVTYDLTIFKADGAENFPAEINGFDRDAIITASFSYKRGLIISFPNTTDIIPVILQFDHLQFFNRYSPYYSGNQNQDIN